jgi:hypothetical protein
VSPEAHQDPLRVLNWYQQSRGGQSIPAGRRASGSHRSHSEPGAGAVGDAGAAGPGWGGPAPSAGGLLRAGQHRWHGGSRSGELS